MKVKWRSCAKVTVSFTFSSLWLKYRWETTYGGKRLSGLWFYSLTPCGKGRHGCATVGHRVCGRGRAESREHLEFQWFSHSNPLPLTRTHLLRFTVSQKSVTSGVGRGRHEPVGEDILDTNRNSYQVTQMWLIFNKHWFSLSIKARCWLYLYRYFMDLHLNSNISSSTFVYPRVNKPSWHVYNWNLVELSTFWEKDSCQSPNF